MEDRRVLLLSIDDQNSGGTFQCTQGMIKFPTIVMMPEKWLSYTKVTV